MYKRQVVPYQLHGLKGEEGVLKYVEVIDLDGNKKDIAADILLPFYGLSMELGPIANWQLEINNKHINVNSATMESNISAIYAIGDIATYSGKLKLIQCGFSEAAMAAHHAYKYIFPDIPLHFEYSTSKKINS